MANEGAGDIRPSPEDFAKMLSFGPEINRVDQKIAPKEEPEKEQKETAPEVITPASELEIKPTQEQLPEFTFQPHAANEFLDTIQGKISLKTLGTFLHATKEDIETQKHAFQRDNAGLIAAAEAAHTFAKSHEQQLPEGHYIAVTQKDGELQTRWEKDSLTLEGETYVFDPGDDPDNPYNLGNYLKKIDEYNKYLPEDIDEGQQALEKIQQKKVEASDLLPVTRIIELYTDSLQSHDADTPQIMHRKEVIEEFNALLKKRIKKDHGVKKFFSSIKEKLFGSTDE